MTPNDLAIEQQVKKKEKWYYNALEREEMNWKVRQYINAL